MKLKKSTKSHENEKHNIQTEVFSQKINTKVNFKMYDFFVAHLKEKWQKHGFCGFFSKFLDF